MHETVVKPQNAVTMVTPPIIRCSDNIYTDYSSNGVNLEWDFQPNLEPGILGFVIERKLSDIDPFKVVSDTINPHIRKYYDAKVPAPQGDHYYYRISALRDEDYPVFSNQLSLFYNPKKAIPRPMALTAEAKINGDKVIVHLAWAKNAEVFKEIATKIPQRGRRNFE